MKLFLYLFFFLFIFNYLNIIIKLNLFIFIIFNFFLSNLTFALFVLSPQFKQYVKQVKICDINTSVGHYRKMNEKEKKEREREREPANGGKR